MQALRTLRALFSLPGFVASARLKGVFGDRFACVVVLRRRKKRRGALLAANRRLNTAYVLKEQFGQLWDYQREGWARAFFERWRESLKWQRLKPYEKFAAMIERH